MKRVRARYGSPGEEVPVEIGAKAWNPPNVTRYRNRGGRPQIAWFKPTRWPVFACRCM